MVWAGMRGGANDEGGISAGGKGRGVSDEEREGGKGEEEVMGGKNTVACMIFLTLARRVLHLAYAASNEDE